MCLCVDIERNSPRQGLFQTEPESLKLSSFSGRLRILCSILDILPGGVVEPRGTAAKYRKMSLLLHPDKCNEPGGEDAFHRVRSAYALLQHISFVVPVSSQPPRQSVEPPAKRQKR